jgi:NAD(P)-dependent dehydrogenase (short-subunit alcohol dehydrogenase family)
VPRRTSSRTRERPSSSRASEERGNALASEINDGGAKAHFVELDVVNQEQWDAAVAEVQDKFGALHVLMNIVGSNAMVMLPEVDIDEWNKVFETNVTGTLRGIRTCAPLMKDSGGGSIVNIGSVAGITGNFGTAYSSSKWALLHHRHRHRGRRRVVLISPLPRQRAVPSHAQADEDEGPHPGIHAALPVSLSGLQAFPGPVPSAKVR